MRIIAGRLKGRRLDAPTWEGLRPTSDKLRETLFNVLAARMPGARLLDGFAGTGAVGLEALSRGAAHVTFVERDPRACRLIAAERRAVRRDRRLYYCARATSSDDGPRGAREPLGPFDHRSSSIRRMPSRTSRRRCARRLTRLAPTGCWSLEHAARDPSAPEPAGVAPDARADERRQRAGVLSRRSRGRIA